MNTKLKGKVRIRLAGDVHNYMRHIPVPASNDTPSTPSDLEEIPDGLGKKSSDVIRVQYILLEFVAVV